KSGWKRSPVKLTGSLLRKKSPGLLLIGLLSLFYLPVMLILVRAFFREGEVSLGNFLTILSRPYYGRLLFFTLLQAFLSALFSLIVALPSAAFFVHYDFPGKKTLLSLTTLSFILPPILVVLGFVIFWGNRGTVNSLLMGLFGLDEPPLKILYSFKAIILAHVFYNVPLALRLLYSQWATMPRSHYEAARLLGASRRQTFRFVTLPRLAPALASSFLIIFLYCFLSFAVILVLGGGPQFSTLEVEIYRLIKFNLDFSLGSALAVGETLICLLAVLIYLKGPRPQEDLSAEEILPARKMAASGLPLLLLYLLISGLFFGGPLLSLVFRSFQYAPSRSAEASLSLEWYARLFAASSRSGTSVTFRAVKNSLFYGGWSTLLAMTTGTGAAFLIHRKKALLPGLTELLLLLPMGISSIVTALGYLLISVGLGESAFLSDLSVILAHTFLALPFVYRTMTTALEQMDDGLRESALIQGAREIQSLIYIELPLLGKSLISGAIFSFALSMGEVNAVLILAPAERITIPIAVYRLIGSYNFPGACAMGTLLILICTAAFLVMNGQDKE
ncbi:MAG: iron ABC transporter permease, partial [Spirochaetales bacterium]|nr:iron ABC transporter permease [Spirochaetales bacterium]